MSGPWRGKATERIRRSCARRSLSSVKKDLGYSTLLLADTPGPVLAPFSALGVAPGATTRLRVGNWVLANDFRRPVQVAREAATLAFLSDGRFDLGLGPGRDDNDYTSLGGVGARAATRPSNTAQSCGESGSSACGGNVL